MEEKIFYVYRWIAIDINEVFYIGKGTGNRCHQIAGRNEIFKKYYNNYNCEVEIIEYFDKEQDAFAKEAALIKYYHKIGQAKASLDNGGKGGCHFVWTDAMRAYQSEYNPMKRSQQRERMSKNNPMQDPEIAEKVNGQKRRPVVINGQRYIGVLEAARQLHVCEDTVIRWCKKGYDAYGNICRYEDELNKNFPVFINPNTSKSLSIYVDDILFPSIKAAAKYYNFSYVSFSKKLKDNNGQIKYKNHICKYANQQPSQENNQSGILEGSET